MSHGKCMYKQKTKHRFLKVDLISYHQYQSSLTPLNGDGDKNYLNRPVSLGLKELFQKMWKVRINQNAPRPG